MLPTPRNYDIWPSVVPADREVEMTVVANERAFLFFEGEEYDIIITDVNADARNYGDPALHTSVKAVARDGVLRFSYTFKCEQEHLIRLFYNEKRLQEFTVFSLYEDLYSLSAFKGDFHGHSYRSDGKRDPAALAGHYREQGYDFFTLTDHNRFYPGGEIDETFEGVNLGIYRVPGEEVHTPGSMVHIVHVGGERGVTDKYVHNREEYDREIEEYMTKVPADIPEAYADRYARAMWATDKIHEDGGLAIFAHPYWRPGSSRMYNVCDELALIMLKSGMFDAYEILGAMTQSDNNRSVALWSALRARGVNISVVGSSDTHSLEKEYTFPNSFTICFAKGNDAESLIAAVKNGMSVAVEATGYEYDRQYRCYGSLRLVTYAHFLLNNFFPKLQRVCQGEGVAMRAYAMNDADKSLIEAQVEQSDKLRKRFFGKMPPKLPDAAIIEFEEKWRKVQLDGPTTKGSTLSVDKITRQI